MATRIIYWQIRAKTLTKIIGNDPTDINFGSEIPSSPVLSIYLWKCFLYFDYSKSNYLVLVFWRCSSISCALLNWGPDDLVTSTRLNMLSINYYNYDLLFPLKASKRRFYSIRLKFHKKELGKLLALSKTTQEDYIYPQ